MGTALDVVVLIGRVKVPERELRAKRRTVERAAVAAEFGCWPRSSCQRISLGGSGSLVEGWKSETKFSRSRGTYGCHACGTVTQVRLHAVSRTHPRAAAI